MDKDEGPIGGLEKPLAPTRQLFVITIILDVLAVLLAFYINLTIALCILLYILTSRAYSYRGIRLKKYPIPAFLIVFIFQGALIFTITYSVATDQLLSQTPIIPCMASSFLIGSLYPLTQIYQHEQDRKDGVISISYLLGKKGTFLFSLCFFLSATILMYLRFYHLGKLNYFYLYLFIMLPVVLFFLNWMIRVWRNGSAADFKSSLLMNMLSTFCTTIFFIILIILKH